MRFALIIELCSMLIFAMSQCHKDKIDNRVKVNIKFNRGFDFWRDGILRPSCTIKSKPAGNRPEVNELESLC